MQSFLAEKLSWKNQSCALFTGTYTGPIFTETLLLFHFLMDGFMSFQVSKSSGSQTQYFPKPEATQISLQIPISQLSQLHTVTDIQHVLNNGLAIPTSIGLEKTKLQVQRPKRPGEKRYTCCYCSWSGVDNWCLKRHLNTHTKPFSCGLCEYKAARAERLATHVHKVHNKRACGRCSFLADDQAQLMVHQQQQHQ